MDLNSVQIFTGSGFTCFFPCISNTVAAQHEEAQGDAQKPAHEAAEGHEKKEGFDANEVIFHHILDAHEFHFFNTGQ